LAAINHLGESRVTLPKQVFVGYYNLVRPGMQPGLLRQPVHVAAPALAEALHVALHELAKVRGECAPEEKFSDRVT
jgi:hypothetical protein